MHYITGFLTQVWMVTLEAAPWLLLGLFAAGLIKAFVPTDWMMRWLGRRGFGSVLRAAIVGTPLPLCSCGVLPAALSLRKQGASRGATVSFLVATPINGVDSFAVSYALLGPFLAIARVIAGMGSAILAGVLSEFSPKTHPTGDASEVKATCGCHSKAESTPEPEAAHSCCGGHKESAHKATGEGAEATHSCCSKQEPEPAAEAHSCCSQKKATAEPEPAAEAHSCCSGQHEAGGDASHDAKPGVMRRLAGGMQFAVSDVLDEIAVWMAVGLIAAGAVAAFVPADALASWGSGIGAMLLMIAVGVPMYICATASIPLATSLLLAGVSPGTVLVFLLAGPATNIGSLAVIRKAIGSWATGAYLAGLCGGAIAFGYATDAVAHVWGLNVVNEVQHAHNMVPAWLSIGSAVLLIVLAIRPLRTLLIRLVTGNHAAPQDPHAAHHSHASHSHSS